MTKPRLIIVEDELIIAHEIQHSLTMLGYEVPAIVMSGEEALEQVRNIEPDLVLMDIKLKGRMSGIEAAAGIHERHHIPVIYMTANADQSTIDLARTTEPYGFIYKPIQQDVLRAVIETALYKHKMEIKLIEREAWLNSTLTSIGEAVVTTDTEGVVTFLNPVAEEMTGWSGKESIGRPIGEIITLVSGTSGKPIPPPVQRVLEDGIKTSMQTDTVLIQRSGRRITIADSASPIQDAHARITGVIIVFRDVSQHRESEIGLLEGSDRCRSFLEKMPAGYFVIDRDGLIRQVNSVWLEMFDYPQQEDVLGRHYLDILQFDSSKEGEAFFHDVLAGDKERLSGEFSRRYRDGREGYHTLTITPLRYQGKLVGAEGFVTDTTSSKTAEQTYSRTETELMQLFEYAPDACLLLDGYGNITDVNSKAVQLFGSRREELLAKAAQEVIHISDGVISDFLAGENTGDTGSHPAETAIIGPNGTEIPVQLSVYPVTRKGSQAVLCIARDIGEIKKYGAVLNETQELFSRLIATIPDMIIRTNIDGEIEFVSEWGLDISGYSAPDIVGKPMLSFIAPEDRARAKETMAQMFEGRLGPREYKLILKNGGQLPFETNGDILRDERGKPFGMVFVCRDISERKEALAALQASEEKYRDLFENSQEAFLILENGVFTDCNQATVEMLGLSSKEQVLNNHPADLSPPIQPDGRDSREKADEMMKISLEKGSHRFEWDHKLPNGEVIPVEVLLTRITKEDGSKIFHTVWHDITEQKRVKQLIELELQEKKVLLREIHHRVKNNLNVIISLLGLQSRRITSKEDAIDAFQKSCDRIFSMALVHDHLYKSKNFSRIDMKPYTESISEQLSRSHPLGGQITFITDIEDNLYLSVTTAVPCGLILNELITNAYKYAFEGRETGTLRVSLSQDKNDVYILTVHDDGIGLSDKIDIDTVQTLGLRLVKILTGQLNGELQITRKGGTAFTIRFQADQE